MPIAVVTGATKGIGLAIVEKLLSENFDVIFCARNKEMLLSKQTELQNLYPQRIIIAYSVDVANQTAVQELGEKIINQFGSVDILVNNAGTYKPGDIATEPDGQLELLLSVNLLGAYYLTRTLLPAIQKSSKAHIFNICSVASLKAYPGGGAYSISKYALLGFSDNLRHELMPTGIKVTAIMPGAVWTDSWSGSDVTPERIMQVQDIADTLWAAYNLSAQAVPEHIILRPQLGDL